MQPNKNDWQYSTIHSSACRVIEEQTLWGQTVCRVWLPHQNTIVLVPQSALQPLNSNLNPEAEAHRITYLAAAAKVADLLESSSGTGDCEMLLAPIESNVIPLPHQIHALSRVISGDRIRYLLADEVGLGKTIEAGLVMRELKLRGLVRRILVVAPKGLATQWVTEMKNHFNEHFQLILGDDINALQRVAGGTNHRTSPWTMFDQVIVSLDSVKPLDKRRGWSEERIAEYNHGRFDDLVSAGWDLVVVDEAHRLGGSTEQVARYKLGKGLSDAAPYVLLLSATPHQGKTDAFHRLVNLLDNSAFPDIESVSRARVAPYVIRTEKRKAIDAEGKPLFKPRRTQLAPISWENRHHLQQLLYEAVTDYVREGYNQALLEKKRHIGFLMILMQRLVTSSTQAIRSTLGRRLEILKGSESETALQLTNFNNGEADAEDFEELYEMDGEELLNTLLTSKIAALKNEISHVETLLSAAIRCEQAGVDAKAEALLEWLYRLQSEENEHDLKVLIFTEFVPTQKMLKSFLEQRGISVTCLNGSMDMEQRKEAQEAFRNSHRVLVSTDAGGEGLNLQFAHVIINYDLPWNPMRIEQRIGRVDRIGQPRTVRAINFVFENSVEFRVREVLEQKLSVIFEEFGIDKTSDVLDSAQATELFEEMFASAILSKEDERVAIETTVSHIRDTIKQVQENSAIHGISESLDAQSAERLRSHPLPHWIEKMTLGYINSHGGSSKRKRSWWEIKWPDGQEQKKCVFSLRELEGSGDATLLNLENSRVRGLALGLPQMTTGIPLPRVAMTGLPIGLAGSWGLFEIGLQSGMHQKTKHLRIPAVRRSYVSVFLTEDGKLFLPTARHVWDAFQTAKISVLDILSLEESNRIYLDLYAAAENAGQAVFDSLRQTHAASLAREEDRGSVAFGSRRKAIKRIGLPEVQQHRLGRCEAEEADWKRELQAAHQIVPEIRPLLMMRIESGVDHD